MAVYVISFIVLLTPLLYALLFTSKLPMRTKVTVGVAVFIVIVFLPTVVLLTHG